MRLPVTVGGMVFYGFSEHKACNLPTKIFSDTKYQALHASLPDAKPVSAIIFFIRILVYPIYYFVLVFIVQ